MALLALAAYYFLNLESFISLDKELVSALNDEKNSTLQFELDKNKSEKLISALYLQRSKLRQQSETLTNSIKQTKEDTELLEPLLKKIKQEEEIIKKELNDVNDQLTKAMIPLEDLEKKNQPLFDRHNELLETLKITKEKFSNLKKETESLEGDLSAQIKERSVAESNFKDKAEELLEELNHPGHLYFGDEIEVEVSSKAPSGKGIFIAEGREAGFRPGMLFLAKKNSAPKEIPVSFQSSLVEDDFTFLELIKLGNSSEVLNIQEGQKLFLIRTGDSNTTD